MFVVTLSALAVLIYENIFTGAEPNYFLAGSAFVLLVLCVFLIIEAWNSFMGKKDKDEPIEAS